MPATESSDWTIVVRALGAAGVDTGDFGRFTADRYPEIIRPSQFDFIMATPVLISVLPRLNDPEVRESVVRSLSTSAAKPEAASVLIDEFRRTSVADHPWLKWAIGNALDTVVVQDH